MLFSFKVKVWSATELIEGSFCSVLSLASLSQHVFPCWKEMGHVLSGVYTY